jgi:hypothetical protein
MKSSRKPGWLSNKTVTSLIDQVRHELGLHILKHFQGRWVPAGGPVLCLSNYVILILDAQGVKVHEPDISEFGQLRYHVPYNHPEFEEGLFACLFQLHCPMRWRGVWFMLKWKCRVWWRRWRA